MAERDADQDFKNFYDPTLYTTIDLTKEYEQISIVPISSVNWDILSSGNRQQRLGEFTKLVDVLKTDLSLNLPSVRETLKSNKISNLIWWNALGSCGTSTVHISSVITNFLVSRISCFIIGILH